MLVETWSKIDILTAELPINGYSVYRCDRNPVNSSFSRDGGILIDVKDDSKFFLLMTSINTIIHLSLKIQVRDEIVIISGIYTDLWYA